MNAPATTVTPQDVTRIALRTAILFGGLSLLWILFSDRVLEFLSDVETVSHLQTAKGFFYVLLTSIFVFWLMRTQLLRYSTIQADGQQAERQRAEQLLSAKEALEKQIAEREQVEAALRQSEERVRTVMEHMPVLMDAFGADGLIAAWNSECERVTGYSAAEMIGNPRAMEILYPDPTQRERIEAELTPDGSTYRDWELELTCRDGSRRVISWSNIAQEHPVPGWATWGVGVDVTARVRAQQALHASEARLRTIVNQMPCLVWITDLNLVFTSFLGRVQEYLNAPAEQYLGRTLHSVFAASGPAPEPVVVHEAALTGQTGTYELAARGRTFNVHVEPLRSNDGQILGAISVALDITARKEAEEEVRLLNMQLERRVEERTAQLQAANRELEAFAYSVSHDLRAPLRAISGFSRILIEEYRANLDDEAQDLLDRVQGNAVRMGLLIDSLLAFSRLNKQAIHLVKVETNTLVRTVVDELLGAQNGRVIQVQIDALPDCYADRALLHQVYTNLISNAIKFSAGQAEARVHIGSQQVDGETRYFVRDNGVGFDMQYAAKLFNVFQRLHRQEEFEGTGVGLAIVQRIVARHEGRVWAESAVNQGATFYFTLGLDAERSTGTENHDD